MTAYPSRGLLAQATAIEREAARVPHERDERRVCLPRCWRCYLDARVRLHARAAEAAKAVADGGPASPVLALEPS